MNIMLGNLSIADMERRTAVDFPDALKELMKDKHQSAASDVQAGKWHCFDIPFILVCGDLETATAIYEMMEPLSGAMATQLQIGVQQ